MKNLTKSAKFSRYVGQFLTYFYMVVLSIIIIYPLLITVSSAFKAGNVTAFSLDLGMQWSLDNFTRLFNETKYLSWYRNTLFVATTTMVVQVFVVTLAGYAYSRYNFMGRYGCLAQRSQPILVPLSDLHRRWDSNEHLVDEGLLRYRTLRLG